MTKLNRTHLLRSLVAGAIAAGGLLAAGSAGAEVVQQSVTLNIAPAASTQTGAAMRAISAIEQSTHGHTLVFTDGGEVDLSASQGLSEADVGNLYNAVTTTVATASGRLGLETALSNGDIAYTNQLFNAAGVFEPLIDEDKLEILKNIHRFGLDEYYEIPLHFEMELLQDMQRWAEFGRQQAFDSMIGGWFDIEDSNVSPYIVESNYYNDSDGNHLRTEEVHSYDIDGSSTSGEVWYYYNTDGNGTDGILIADYDLDNNGYRDGTIADRIAKLLSGKKKDKNKDNNGDGDDDSNGLIIMRPYPVQWMWLGTEPRYDRLLLTDQMFAQLFANGTIDAIRAHIQSSHNQNMSPDATVIQTLLDAGFVPINTSYHAVDAFALDLTVVQGG